MRKLAYSFTASELEYFQDEVLPWLEDHDGSLKGEKEFTDASPELVAALSDYSATGMVFENSGFLDFLFAFFGISTAFKLGRSGFGS